MIHKLKKYSGYIRKFVKSDAKKAILTEVLSEMKTRGLIEGIQSFLHKNQYYFFPGYNLSVGNGRNSSLNKYNEKIKLVLPEVSRPSVSIIIPVHNQLQNAYCCVRSILEQENCKDYEIIISDDASEENSDFLKWHLQNAIVLKNGKNLGYLRNCNAAAKKARGRYIVVLNSDTLVKKDWLSELLMVFARFDDVGIVGSKLVYPDNKLEEAGGIIWQNGDRNGFGEGDEPDKPQYNYIKEADYVSGVSFMIRKDVWDELGGFDDRYMAPDYVAADLCFEAREKGYKVYYQPFSEIVHFDNKFLSRKQIAIEKKSEEENKKTFNEKWSSILKTKAEKDKNLFFERDRSGQKKHLLFVHDTVPDFSQQNDGIINNSVGILLDLGYKLTFLTTDPKPNETNKKILQEQGVEVQWHERYGYFGKTLNDYLEASFSNFDGVFLNGASVSVKIILYLRKNKYRGQIVYYPNGFKYEDADRDMVINKDVSYDLHIKKARAEEDFVYQHADSVLIDSYNELQYVRKFKTARIFYTPAYYSKVIGNTPGFESRSGLLFAGGFDQIGNGIMWFLSEAYEPLHKRGIKLTIACNNVPPYIHQFKLKYPLLEFYSDVSEEGLNTLYAQAKVCIAPIRGGAPGLKGKVLESMAHGVPVAGTFLAFDDMPKPDGFLYEGHSTSSEMIENILQIYDNSDYWNRLSEFGKHYVTEYFDREKMTAVFRKLF